ncbi:MAG: protein-glutamate O-methyltransferase CheR [Geobacteraceae bacterium]
MNSVLEDISRVMQEIYGKDIYPFEESFLEKTLEKRLSQTLFTSFAAYSAYLSESNAEADALFRALTISYSEFFRNSLTFALIEQLLIPILVDEKVKSGRPEIRVWSAACAAGQEPYSVAILLDELLNARSSTVSYRIFATDFSETDLDLARQGVYDFSAVRNLRAKHLHEYFTCSDETYSIVPRIKAHVDFSCYNLLDGHSVSPPASIFGDFDLVLCSNLLFYYKPDMREIILDKAYRSLSPNGYLVTGEAERDMIAGRKGLRAVAPPAAIFQKTGRGR